MKLRIKGNSIRLRLTQDEVACFGRQGAVRDSISFDPSGRDALIYSLEICSSCLAPEADFSGNNIRVKVPEKIAREWVGTGLVGFDNRAQPSGNTSLDILVEKDFQCLHKRPNEDESDNFPNPLADKTL